MPEITYNRAIKKVSRATRNSRDVSHRSKPVTTSNHTTPPAHCIYKIECTPTGKAYIGQTIDPRQRKINHFCALKNNRHFNPYLQHAYNKHGRQAFTFAVIENEISTPDIDTRETYWISCFPDGYNMAEGGRKPPGTQQPCLWNDQVYPSQKAAAIALNITQNTLYQRLKKGYSGDADMPFKSYHLATPCRWNGIDFPSIEEAARANEISQNAMWSRINKGYTCDQDIKNNNGQGCSWNGIIFSSIRQAAQANNITPVAMMRRLKAGYTCDTDMKRNRTLNK